MKKHFAVEADYSQLVAKLAKRQIDTGITVGGVQLALSAENWEGIACEFRKYTNLES